MTDTTKITPIFLLRPEGSRSRYGRDKPALAGDIVQVPGTYGSAWRVDPGGDEIQFRIGSTSSLGFAILGESELNTGAS